MGPRGTDASVWLLIGLAIGCADDAAPERPSTREPASAEVVARVDGVAIEGEAVRQYAIDHHVSPEEALEHLIEVELLASAARSGDAAAQRDVAQARRRAAVQRLLSELIEAGTAPEEIAPGRVQETYEARVDRVSTPERRTLREIRFRFDRGADEGALRRKAEAALADVRRAGDPSAVHAVIDARREEADVIVHGPIDREAELPAELIDAAFDSTQVGPLGGVVRSDRAYHVALVDAVLPASVIPLEEVEPQIRADLSRSDRIQKTRALLEQLGQRYGVTRLEENLAGALGLEIPE